MLNPIKYKPTVFKTTARACSTLIRRREEDAPFFAVEIIKNAALANNPTKKPSLFTRIKNMFYNRSQLSVIIDSKDKYNFVLTTQRTLNKKIFNGAEVPVNIERLLNIKDEASRLINESKWGMLKEIKK